jgi:hypothetical protein
LCAACRLRSSTDSDSLHALVNGRVLKLRVPYPISPSRLTGGSTIPVRTGKAASSGLGRRERAAPNWVPRSRVGEPTAWLGLRRNRHGAIFLFRRRRAETIRDQGSVCWEFVLVGIANAYAQSDCSFSRCGDAGLTICGRVQPRSVSRHHRVSLIETTLLRPDCAHKNRREGPSAVPLNCQCVVANQSVLQIKTTRMICWINGLSNPILEMRSIHIRSSHS